MSRIYIPTASADDWQRFLAKPERHWRTGYSARTLAHCWEGAAGFPGSVDSVLRAAEDPFPRHVTMLLGLPERKVSLPGGCVPRRRIS